MYQPYDPPFVTLFAELADRVADAGLIEDLPPGGTFERRTINGRDYWYHRAYSRPLGRDKVRYVGPASPELDARVSRHAALMPDIQGRRRLVATLKRAGFPAPDTFTGEVIAALARAGVFRLRAVLVGTVAFHCYAALLGVRLPATAMRTEDLDVAQFHGIAVSVGDKAEPILDGLREIDPSFTLVPSLASRVLSNTVRNARGYRVELLYPHEGSDDRGDRLEALPTMPGLAAQPLRFLDFLIRHEVRTAVLHGAGVAVNVPAPERYAVHKLIIATKRRVDSRVKSLKDIAQASALIQAMAETRQGDMLRDAWEEAYGRGPSWRKALDTGRARLDPVASTYLGFILPPTSKG